jgi:hypothetical protein
MHNFMIFGYKIAIFHFLYVLLYILFYTNWVCHFLWLHPYVCYQGSILQSDYENTDNFLRIQLFYHICFYFILLSDKILYGLFIPE